MERARKVGADEFNEQRQEGRGYSHSDCLLSWRVGFVRQSTVVLVGHTAKPCHKRKLSRNKLLVSIWWTYAGPNGNYCRQMYCEKLQVMVDKLAVKQPRLVNCSWALLHDNAWPYTEHRTVSKLQQLPLETLDLDWILYTFFQQIFYLYNFLQRKN